jgi:phospholipase C
MDAKPGNPLYDQGMVKSLSMIADFGNDIKNGKLPQVSWLVAPTAKSEHACNHPAAGEDWTAQILNQLKANPSVYAKSVFILNYDEGGQFFDHHWTPTVPIGADNGMNKYILNFHSRVSSLIRLSFLSFFFIHPFSICKHDIMLFRQALQRWMSAVRSTPTSRQ